MNAGLKCRTANMLRRHAAGRLFTEPTNDRQRERLAKIWTKGQSDEQGLRLTAINFTDQELIALPEIGRTAVRELRAEYGAENLNPFSSGGVLVIPDYKPVAVYPGNVVTIRMPYDVTVEDPIICGLLDALETVGLKDKALIIVSEPILEVA